MTIMDAFEAAFGRELANIPKPLAVMGDQEYLASEEILGSWNRLCQNPNSDTARQGLRYWGELYAHERNERGDGTP